MYSTHFQNLIEPREDPRQIIDSSYHWKDSMLELAIHVIIFDAMSRLSFRSSPSEQAISTDTADWQVGLWRR